MQKILNLLIITILTLTVVGCIESKRDPGILVVATAGDMPPYNYYNNENNLVGYDVDIAKEIAKRLNKQIEFSINPCSRFVPLLLAKRIDMIVSSVDNQDQMKRLVNFSDDYNYAITYFAAKKGAELDSFYEVHGTPMVIGVTNGTTAAQLLQNQGMEDNLRIYPSKTDLYMALNTNKITGILAFDDELKFFQGKKGNSVELEKKEDVIGDSHLSIAVNKDNKELLAKLNKIIKEMKQDGTISKIGLKWLHREPFPKYSQKNYGN